MLTHHQLEPATCLWGQFHKKNLSHQSLFFLYLENYLKFYLNLPGTNELKTGTNVTWRCTQHTHTKAITQIKFLAKQFVSRCVHPDTWLLPFHSAGHVVSSQEASFNVSMMAMSGPLSLWIVKAQLSNYISYFYVNGIIFPEPKCNKETVMLKLFSPGQNGNKISDDNFMCNFGNETWLIMSVECDWQGVITGLNNSLVPNRRQAII